MEFLLSKEFLNIAFISFHFRKKLLTETFVFLDGLPFSSLKYNFALVHIEFTVADLFKEETDLNLKLVSKLLEI